MMVDVSWLARWSALALTLLACSSPPGSDETAQAQGAFVAYAPAFQGFRAWESFKIADAPAVSGIHTSGSRTEYLKSRPEHGATSFPVGTIIVKEFDATSAGPGQILAMVKRGDGYNAAGADGWEWFELKPAANGSFAILWRGVAPPSGESYNGDPTGGCNSCHGAASDNDSVRSTAIRLSGF